MIKNTLFITVISLGLWVNSAIAQITQPDALEQMNFGQADFSFDSIKELLDNLAAAKPISDDLLLNTLLATPFEKRQYVFPALHENAGIPKKILSHPQIAIFKGKQPSTIPARLENFAKEYLAYLPASYYVYLDPDYWREIPKEEPSVSTGALAGAKRIFKITTHQGENYTYPKVQSLYKLSPETEKNYKKTDLKAKDVNNLFKAVKALDAYIENQPDPREIKHSLISIMLQNNKVEQDFSFPFLSLVSRLKMIKPASEIDAIFKNQGWENAEEFAKKSDRILKAYRVHSLNPMIAIQLNKIRAYPADAPTTEALENLRMYANMYQAAPGDVYFVEPYLEEIRKNLKPDFVLFMGTPIYME